MTEFFLKPCFEFGGPGLGCGLAGAGLVGQSSRIGGLEGDGCWGAAGGCWALLGAAGGCWARGCWGLLGLLGAAGAAGGLLGWAGLALWAGGWGLGGGGGGAGVGWAAGLGWSPYHLMMAKVSPYYGHNKPLLS